MCSIRSVLSEIQPDGGWEMRFTEYVSSVAVEIPEGMQAELICQGKTVPLAPGRNAFEWTIPAQGLTGMNEN